MELIADHTPPVKHWRIGTLVYTQRTLVLLFFWLLAGDFCFTVMEQVIPTLLPLDLKAQAASNTTIGLIVGTIPSAMNTVFTPIIAFRSDRHRGRFGRRIPYLLWSTPVISIFLVVAGFSPQIGRWLHEHLSGGRLSESMTIVLTIAFAAVVFQFFNLFATSIYYYLFRDVVPADCLGRFVGLFRVVGSLGLFVYNRYIFGLSTMYREQIYIVAAIVYCVAFMLMCWRVKEGEYPPPPPATVRGRSNWIASVVTYFRECFTNRTTLLLYSVTCSYAAGVAAVNTFLVFFALSLGLSRDEFGKFAGWTWLIPVAISIPLGYLVDKLRPIRVALSGVSLMVAAAICGFIAIRGPGALLVIMLVFIFGKAIYDVAMLPVLMTILPGDRFGQFASANAVCSAVGYMIGSYGAGWFLDGVGSYRFVYLWCGVFTGISTVFMTSLYLTTRDQARPHAADAGE